MTTTMTVNTIVIVVIATTNAGLLLLPLLRTASTLIPRRLVVTMIAPVLQRMTVRVRICLHVLFVTQISRTA